MFSMKGPKKRNSKFSWQKLLRNTKYEHRGQVLKKNCNLDTNVPGVMAFDMAGCLPVFDILCIGKVEFFLFFSIDSMLFKNSPQMRTIDLDPLI